MNSSNGCSHMCKASFLFALPFQLGTGCHGLVLSSSTVGLVLTVSSSIFYHFTSHKLLSLLVEVRFALDAYGLYGPYGLVRTRSIPNSPNPSQLHSSIPYAFLYTELSSFQHTPSSLILLIDQAWKS